MIYPFLKILILPFVLFVHVSFGQCNSSTIAGSAIWAAKADSLFDQKNFFDAWHSYIKAFSICTSDPVREKVPICEDSIKYGQRRICMDNQFDKTVEVADWYFKSKNWDKATEHYLKAQQYKSNDVHVNSRLNKLQRKIYT